MEIYNALDILYKSKCYTCLHRMSRLIEPVNQEDRDYYIDMLDIEIADNIDSEQEVLDLLIEQHKCLITDEDIDGIIHECTQYISAIKSRLIREYMY